MGVAVFLSKKMSGYMKKWKCGSDRIMRVKTKNCCCVGDSDQVYALTE